MGIVKLNLLSRYTRPVIRIDTDLRDVIAIIDTGAIKSIWNGNTKTLKQCFPQAVPTNYITTVSGFGGESTTDRRIWEIPVFELTDDEDSKKKYVLHNFLVAVVDDRNLGFDLVIAASALKKVNYGIFNMGKSKDKLVIACSDRKYCCVVGKTKAEGKYIRVNEFSSFLQDDSDDEDDVALGDLLELSQEI